MHAMNINHPNFISLVESIANGFSEFVTSGALSPGYLLTPANRSQQGLVTILNLFNVFERPIGEIFALMEDDLRGKFSRPLSEAKGKIPENRMYPEKPYIRDGKFHFRNQIYDKVALIPLVMDFSRDHGEWGKSYYTSQPQEKILSYVKDTLDGIEWYRKIRPEGLLEFFPFLGINPEVHQLDFIRELLSSNLRSDKSLAWTNRKARKGQRFRGIKLYPPLGTDPWPSETERLEKITFIYQFCEKNDIPIITHCDDQGFRGVTSKLAQQYTSPAAWIPVFEAFPNLRVDFAHYGKQYNVLAKGSLKALIENSFTSGPWFKELVHLMQNFPQVYADFSFSGTDPKFYEDLHEYISASEDKELQEILLSRSMFGSDFSMNLAKVESYTNYYRIFEESPFPSDAIERFVSENPLRFLGLQSK
jgi:predicted TIM-barrel fold metal-dependent hydrolase